MPNTTIVVETVDSYVLRFDSDNSNWSENPDYNLVFARSMTGYLNQVLSHRGHLFLNDLFDNLGMPRTPGGQVTGWLKTKGVLDVDVEPHVGYLELKFMTHGVVVNDI
jgi:hypothetical protein